MSFWIEPVHDNRRCGFMGRAGRVFWIWRFTWHFRRLPDPTPAEQK